MVILPQEKPHELSGTATEKYNFLWGFESVLRGSFAMILAVEEQIAVVQLPTHLVPVLKRGLRASV